MRTRERVVAGLKAFNRPDRFYREAQAAPGSPIVSPGSIPTTALSDGFQLPARPNDGFDLFDKAVVRIGQAATFFRKALAPNIPVGDPKGYETDPYGPWSTTASGEYRERPGGISNDVLRAMSYRCTPIAAIIATRCNQVAQFARPQKQRGDMGFRIMPRDNYDTENASPVVRRRIAELSRLMMLCGGTWGNRHKRRPNLEMLLRMVTRDSLTFDQAAIQVRRDALGRPAEWFAMPGSTIRVAYHEDSPSWNWDPNAISFKQVIRDQEVADFTANELLWLVRNPRSDLEVCGYGFSELELLVGTVTAILWSHAHNEKFFSQGSTIKGVLNLKGFLPKNQLRAFRREWFNLVSGVTNSWRTPIMNVEDVQFVNMHSSNKDMEFTEWLYYLLKLACSVYQIDPTEINFQFGNVGQQMQVFESNNEARSRMSKDRGLRPLVTRLEDMLNEILVEIDPDFVIELAGLDARTDEQLANLAQMTSTVMTIDEFRDRYLQMGPMYPEGSGSIIRSGEFMTALQALSMQQQGAVDAEQRQLDMQFGMAA